MYAVDGNTKTALENDACVIAFKIVFEQSGTFSRLAH